MNKETFLIVGVILFVLGCKTKTISNEKKIHGVSLVASKDSLAITEVEEIKKVHANYVALMPFAFVKDLNHPEIIYDNEKQWFGETSVGIEQYKAVLDSLQIKVMLKPQLWVWKGQYTGDILMKDEMQWKEFEQQYENYILNFARLAAQLKIAIFCIGTELHNFTVDRPDFFRKLIQKIRGIYQGKLTYAENWDVYRDVPFWDDLDYIGIDAYFPVSDKQTPTLDDLEAGWKLHKEAMESYATATQKQILFTEYGYRSIDYAGKEPWNHERSTLPSNYRAQANCITGLYQSVWKEPWFAGGFLWKWFPNIEALKGQENRFTIQNKPARQAIEHIFSTESKVD